MEVQSQLQSLLSLFGADGELFPDSVESRQSVSRRARRTAQRLAEDDGRLQQLTAVVIGALKEKSRTKTNREMELLSVCHTSVFRMISSLFFKKVDGFKCLAMLAAWRQGRHARLQKLGFFLPKT